MGRPFLPEGEARNASPLKLRLKQAERETLESYIEKQNETAPDDDQLVLTSWARDLLISVASGESRIVRRRTKR